MKRAFTLIELLVVIAIIAVLIGVLLPALSTGRQAGRLTVGLANLRSVSQVLAAYVQNHKDLFPYPFYIPPVDEEGQTNSTLGPFDVINQSNPKESWTFADQSCDWYHGDGFAGVWYSFLAEWRGGHRLAEEQYSPADADLQAARRQTIATSGVGNMDMLAAGSFELSSTVWCQPARYNGFTLEQMTPQLLRSSSMADIAFPAQKAIVFERADFRQQGRPKDFNDNGARFNTAVGDGSIVPVEMSKTLRPSISTVPPPCGPVGYPFMHTQHGLKGRDF
jgi:prepilin-type N-terminal cleavage/methylation domain-containing protein